MAKKQKAKDKKDINDESIDTEATLEEGESIEEVVSLAEEADENQNTEEKIKDIEEA